MTLHTFGEYLDFHYGWCSNKMRGQRTKREAEEAAKAKAKKG